MEDSLGMEEDYLNGSYTVAATAPDKEVSYTQSNAAMLQRNN